MESIFAINKPLGITSHDVINQLRQITGEKRIGHAGTLDPLASGVLVVGVGREATKKLGQIVAKEKEYLATLKLGQTSTTDDEEGQKTASSVNLPPSQKQVEKALTAFIGQINQVPPAFSAIKVKGQTAYKLARQGRPLALSARQVTIKTIELLSYNYPLLKIKVVCQAGVYIRSLARDLGAKLKTGGYLLALERTRVGEWQLDQALSLEELKTVWSKG